MPEPDHLFAAWPDPQTLQRHVTSIQSLFRDHISRYKAQEDKRRRTEALEGTKAPKSPSSDVKSRVPDQRLHALIGCVWPDVTAAATCLNPVSRGRHVGHPPPPPPSAAQAAHFHHHQGPHLVPQGGPADEPGQGRLRPPLRHTARRRSPEGRSAGPRQRGCRRALGGGRARVRRSGGGCQDAAAGGRVHSVRCVHALCPRVAGAAPAALLFPVRLQRRPPAEPRGALPFPPPRTRATP